MSFIREVGNEVANIIGTFIEANMRESEAEGVVIGLSGGIDSAVCAKLCADVLGSDSVHLFFMPESATPQGDYGDVKKISEHLDVPVHTIPIGDLVEDYERLLSGSDMAAGTGGQNEKRARINVKPRIRVGLLFYFANLWNCLVIGPSNKSELLTGYFTKFGDGASDLALIGDLYKTQVFQLAGILELPTWLMEKKPSPGLAHGINDEDELKISYARLDQILAGFDFGYDVEYIAERVGIPVSEVERVRRMVDSTIHKRRFPRIPKIGLYTVGVDRKEY